MSTSFPISAEMAALREAVSSASTEAAYSGERRGVYFCIFLVSPEARIVDQTSELEAIPEGGIKFTVRDGRGPKGYKVKLRVSAVQFTGVRVVITRLAFVTSWVSMTRGVFIAHALYNNIRQSLNQVKTGRLLNYSKVQRVWGPRPSSPMRPSPETTVQSFPWIREWNGAVSNSGTDSYTTRYREWTGTRTPGFGALEKAELPINPHTVFMYRREDLGTFDETLDMRPGSGNVSRSTSAYLRQIGTSSHGSQPSSCLHDDSLHNRALKRLIDKSSGGIVANLAQDIFQLQQTGSVVGDAAMRIARAGAAVRKKQFNRAVAALWSGRGRVRLVPGVTLSRRSSLADNWLALQYGWKPLIQDIYGSMEALANFFSRNDSIVWRTVASASSKGGGREKLFFNALLSAGCGTKTEMLASSCRFCIYWRIENRLTAFLSQTGLTNPVNLAWELLPFSFVADWALPIGPYLESLSAFHGVEFVKGYKTQFTRSETTYCHSYSGLEPNANDPAVLYNSWGALRWKQIRLTRSPLNGFPSAVLPRFKNPLSITHAANGIALLVSVFGGGRVRHD